jgi:isochorismate hydrolase
MPLESKRRQKFTRIAAMRIIFTHIGCILLTCDMYMSDLRHIHDPVLSSSKMEGTRLLFFHTSAVTGYISQDTLKFTLE